MGNTQLCICQFQVQNPFNRLQLFPLVISLSSTGADTAGSTDRRPFNNPDPGPNRQTGGARLHNSAVGASPNSDKHSSRHLSIAHELLEAITIHSQIRHLDRSEIMVQSSPSCRTPPL